MDVSNYIKKCHTLAVQNGWWINLPHIEPDRSEFIADKIDLIAGEGAEMVEAIRRGKKADLVSYSNAQKSFKRQFGEDAYSPDFFKIFIKDSLADELADVFIKTCDIMGFCDITEFVKVDKEIEKTKKAMH